MLTSLTMQTELLTLSGLSFLEDHGSYIVQSTPSEPNYWVGNQLILRDASFDAEAAEKAFARHFPNAAHRAVVWDIPDLSQGAISSSFQDEGYAPEHVDALVLEGAVAPAETPAGIVIRSLETEDDWYSALGLQEEIGVEDGYVQESYRPYLIKRNAGRRQQISKGLGQWFGAFEDDLLVGQMGIFHNREVARYQSVETRASHRKRGIASALLRHASLWALGRAPKARIVIVAETDSAAGRLYRSMGFVHSETIRGVIRSGV